MRILLFTAMLSLFAVGCQRSDDTVVDPNTSDSAMNQTGETQTRLTGFTTPPSADESVSVAPVVLTATENQQADWLDWRGPYFNGYSPVTGLPDEFDPDGGEGSNVAWKAPFGGRSTPVVMNGKLYTLVRAEPETAREGERIVCLDAKTGDLIWENRFNVYLSDVPDTRVGWSSVVADPETNAVYGLGVCGHFVCADADTGETRWQIPLHERFGLLSTYGGRTNFPVICDDLVIVSAIIIGWGDAAKPNHRFIGLDKRTGEVVWFNGTRDLPYDTSYSGPVLTSFNGQKAMVVGCGDGAVWAFQPRTGKAIWSFNLSRRGLNSPPLVDGNTIYAGHAEENMEGTAMGALASINTGDGNITKTGKNWLIEEVAAGRTQPIKVGNHIWVFTDQAKLLVFDPETGEQVGRRVALGTMMRSSPLQADGKVYAFTVNSRWAILEPDDRAGAKIVSKGRLPRGEETHASPICVDGRIYVQTTGGLYCLKDESQESGWGETLELPQEAAITDESPAWVQVIPADALLRPGDTQQFKVKLYNSLGQFVGDANNAEFSIAGRGSISSDGKLSLPEDMAHEAIVVTAKVGDLVGEGRVRVVPPLPWKFDFEQTAINNGKGEPPVTWVGARYRHVVREEDGNKVMVKITTIPKGTRSRCWFGQSDLHDYTIQADVKGAIVDNKMPDIGLLAQGYALDLQGASQQLQIRSWVPQLRMAVTIPFPWEADTWYTMKLQASVEGGKALVKGKVWPKSESEPTDWTIEATDEVPNLSGSPGLYGNAKDAEIFLDNLSVYANP